MAQSVKEPPPDGSLAFMSALPQSAYRHLHAARQQMRAAAHFHTGFRACATAPAAL